MFKKSQASDPPPKNTSLTAKLARTTPAKRREIVTQIESDGTEAQKAALAQVPDKYKH